MPSRKGQSQRTSISNSSPPPPQPDSQAETVQGKLDIISRELIGAADILDEGIAEARTLAASSIALMGTIYKGEQLFRDYKDVEAGYVFLWQSVTDYLADTQGYIKSARELLSTLKPAP